MKSYSQLGQDVQVLKFLNNKKNGYFVDIGANDGITLSNTYLLEKNFDWTGICSEPNPQIFNQLLKNRPNSHCNSNAVYSESNQKLLFSITRDSLFSGITEFITLYKEKLVNSSTVSVETISLADLLKKFNAPQSIDYLSIDTEGSEFEILKNFPFQEYHFKIIHIEHNFLEPNKSLIQQLLINNNYYFLEDNKWDATYVYIEASSNFCRFFLNSNIDNKKGISFEDRFVDVMADPNNLLIKRHPKAGQIEGNNVILHNGIKVLKEGYYGEFSKILVLNKGCHEPAEERMFQEILETIPPNALMIELGSYWAFYTIWFQTRIPGARNICVEPELDNLNIGLENCKLNNVKAEFIQGFIGKNALKVTQIIKERNIDFIDILHSDIQGYEVEMMEDIAPLLQQKKIGCLFISTHSDEIHSRCLEILKSNNYKIIASADFSTETFCYDGIIVSVLESSPLKETYLGCRKFTKL